MCQDFDGAASEPSAFICIHKCLLCYAQEGINKNLLLSVNERSTQTRAAALKIDLTEGHCWLFKWTSLLRLGLCVTQCEGAALYFFMWMHSVKPDYVSSLRPGYTLQSQFTACYDMKVINLATTWNLLRLYDENTNWTHHRWIYRFSTGWFLLVA